MEVVSNVTLYGLIALIINGVFLWIREWRKHRTWSANGKDLKEIKEDVKDTNEKIDGIEGTVGETQIKVAEIKVAVGTQARHCKQTVERFDKAITNQGNQLIDIAKGK
ncbi:hypothetical protein LCGC14_2058340 [marine sediment metagenome]|uniref:Uncharacterized protein n=1 Tax=marine sediment metagenome TaxID=412755 RepID=A0A0F9H0E0_9ZZZZ